MHCNHKHHYTTGASRWPLAPRMAGSRGGATVCGAAVGALRGGGGCAGLGRSGRRGLARFARGYGHRYVALGFPHWAFGPARTHFEKESAQFEIDSDIATSLLLEFLTGSLSTRAGARQRSSARAPNKTKHKNAGGVELETPSSAPNHQHRGTITIHRDIAGAHSTRRLRRGWRGSLLIISGWAQTGWS